LRADYWFAPMPTTLLIRCIPLHRPCICGPDDIHVVGRNASKTEPAKFLVGFVKNKGAPH